MDRVIKTHIILCCVISIICEPTLACDFLRPAAAIERYKRRRPDISTLEHGRYTVNTIEDLRGGVSILVAYFSNKKHNDVELPSGNGRVLAINALRRILQKIGEERDLASAQSLVFEWAHKYLEGADRIGRLRPVVAKISGQELTTPMFCHITYLINSCAARIANPHAFDETPLGMYQIMWEREYFTIIEARDPSLDKMIGSILEKLSEDFPEGRVGEEIKKLEADIAELETRAAATNAAILESHNAGRRFQAAGERLSVILRQMRALEQRHKDLLTIRDMRQKLIAIRSLLPLKRSPERMIEGLGLPPRAAASSI